MRVVGIDPGEKCTGLVFRDGVDVNPCSITPEYGDDLPIARVEQMAHQVCKRLQKDDFVVMESPIVGHHSSAIPLIMLSGFLQLWLFRSCKRTYVLVHPMTLKKFVLGIGKGKKDLIMKEVYKRWGFDAPNEHEADAFGLSQIGLVLAGKVPESELIQAQKDVIKKVRKYNPPILV